MIKAEINIKYLLFMNKIRNKSTQKRAFPAKVRQAKAKHINDKVKYEIKRSE